MAAQSPAGPERVTIAPDDVAAIALMAQIAERAGSGTDQQEAEHSAAGSPNREVHVPSEATGEPATHSVSGSQLHEARVLLSQQNSVGQTRMKLAKRLALRGSRLFTHRLVGAGLDIADAVEVLEVTHGAAIAEVKRQLEQQTPDDQAALQRDAAVAELAARVSQLELDNDRLSNSLHAQLASVELATDDAAANQDRITTTLHENAKGLDARLSALERSSDYDRSELHRTRTLVSRLVRTAATATPSTGTASTAGDAARADAIGHPATLDDSTYVDFEHRFRGTRDEIRARQRDAVPFMTGLAGDGAPVLDLGCGRGEWLELLGELTIPAYGVDSNTAMVQEAVDAGLDVRLEDALAHLEQLGGSSLRGLTAFHFVEHIPMDVLVRLLDGALVALRPGGLLLLETPNPTNLIVGAANFYLDPTHLRVLHPDFLAFLVESRGFVDVQVHYVHPVIDEAALRAGQIDDPEADARLARVVRNVEWALFGPQDYLLFARRPEVAL